MKITETLAWLKYLRALLFVLLLSPLTASAGLYELFLRAQQNDSAYAAARATYEGDQEYHAIGRSYLLPSLTLHSEATSEHTERQGTTVANQPTLPSQTYSFNPQSASLHLNQPLLDFSLLASRDEAYARADLGEMTFAGEQLSLVLRVAQAWFDYLLAQDGVDLARAQKEAYIGQQEQAEHLYKGGMGTRTDVEESRARVELAQSQELVATNALAVKKRELEKIIGPGVPPAVSVSAVQLVAPDPDDVSQWAETAREHNIKVLAQRVNLRIASAQADHAQAGNYPNLSLVGDYTTAHEPDFYTDHQQTALIGLRMDLPVYQGGRLTAQSRQAAAYREKARDDVDTSMRDAEIKTTEAFLGISNGIRQIHAMEQAVKSAEITVEGMEAGQKAGLRTNTDVLNAQQQLYTSRYNLQKERYNYLISRVQLRAAIGALNGEDLQILDGMIGR